MQANENASRDLTENPDSRINGLPRSGPDAQQVHDAMDYELESLIGGADKEHDEDDSSSDGHARRKVADEEQQVTGKLQI